MIVLYAYQFETWLIFKKYSPWTAGFSAERADSRGTEQHEEEV